MTGIERFNSYLEEWEALAEKANASGNIAEYCLNNNARTIFFMLEALCKIYKNMHNEKTFSKQGDRFKTVEDLLGDMDHYRECIDDYKQRENIEKVVMDFYESKYQEARNELNNLLIEKDWLNGKRIKKIRKKLDEADWLPKKEEVYGFRKYYLDEIEEFKDLYVATGNFTLIEDHLHEFRRRLRWFSIYPHALKGAVQFAEDAAIPDELLKYQTDEIITSPFNKFPPPGDQIFVLTLEKNRFLALSWMIDALGRLKDKGLLEENLMRAVEATDASQPPLNIAQFEKEILREANNIMHTFMQDRILDDLVREVIKL